MTARGYRKPSNARPNERVDGYDSRFERDLHKGVLKGWEEHGIILPYTIEHNYHPDFNKEIDGVKIILEAKGRFWTAAEYAKYLHVRAALPEGYKLIFLFYDPETPMPRAKKRKKCGTKRTMGEWATSQGFEWYTKHNFPEELK
jgi:hypothetical protein